MYLVQSACETSNWHHSQTLAYTIWGNGQIAFDDQITVGTGVYHGLTMSFTDNHYAKNKTEAAAYIRIVLIPC